MHAKLKDSIDTFAVIMNKEQRISEVLDCGCLHLVQCHIDHLQKYASFGIAFGGCDSAEKFHCDPARVGQVAVITVKTPVFEQYFVDGKGNPEFCWSEDKLKQLFTEILIPAADKFVWTFEEIEITDKDDKVIFKKTKPAKS